jgi:hypothetical protein
VRRAGGWDRLAALALFGIAYVLTKLACRTEGQEARVVQGREARVVQRRDVGRDQEQDRGWAGKPGTVTA